MKDCREFQFANLRTTPIARFSFRMQIQETRHLHDNYLILVYLTVLTSEMSLVDLVLQRLAASLSS